MISDQDFKKEALQLLHKISAQLDAMDAIVKPAVQLKKAVPGTRKEKQLNEKRILANEMAKTLGENFLKYLKL